MKKSSLVLAESSRRSGTVNVCQRDMLMLLYFALQEAKPYSFLLTVTYPYSFELIRDRELIADL